MARETLNFVIFVIYFTLLSVPSRGEVHAALDSFNARQSEQRCPENLLQGICLYTEDACTSDASCPDGLICCPQGCNPTCVRPVTPDKCLRYSFIKIFCKKSVDECEVDDDCKSPGAGCCPYGNCGRKCVKVEDVVAEV